LTCVSNYLLRCVMVFANDKHSCRMSGDERRLSILLSSIPLFAEKGFNATTTKEIADNAGVSEALLYRHFSGKEKLYGAIHNLICSQTDQIHQRMNAMPDSIDSLVDILFFIIVVINTEDIDELGPAIPRLLIMSILEDGKFIKEFVHTKFVPLQGKIGALYRAAQNRGEINKDLKFSEKEIMLFTHQLAVGLRIGDMPGPIYDYGVDHKTKLFRAAELVFRGIGIKESIISSIDFEKQYQTVFEVLNS
jgi:AcrR family transcriptional regulator